MSKMLTWSSSFISTYYSFPLLHPLQLLPLVNVAHLVPSFSVIYLDLPTLFVGLGPDIAVLSLVMVKQGDAEITSLTTHARTPRTTPTDERDNLNAGPTKHDVDNR